MDRKKVAKELIGMAKEIICAENPDNSICKEIEKNAAGEDVIVEEGPKKIRRLDPSMNALVNKVIGITGGDIVKMLTLIIMVLRKTGHSAEANKIYALFRQLLKKIEQSTGLLD